MNIISDLNKMDEEISIMDEVRREKSKSDDKKVLRDKQCNELKQGYIYNIYIYLHIYM